MKEREGGREGGKRRREEGFNKIERRLRVIVGKEFKEGDIRCNK